ncbi:MAG: nitrous oxide-stimulated promoter family protein [Gammaproteobacteria bacterium]|nr:nitrous oxide-stimulated promoter family protein [Gammaproteobacteria bacterium]
MEREKKRIEREFLTMTKMVGMYCARFHRSGEEVCPECQAFLGYASRRLEKCPYGEDKPTCVHCPIHCYKPEQKALASQIMRYAGPRMLLRHPLLAIAHKLDGFRKVGHPIELSREARRKERQDKAPR